MSRISRSIFALFVCLNITVAQAGEADVLEVKAKQSSNKTWTFHVKVQHADEGWDHYANRWEILSPDGKILGTRGLAHPHVQEQPFTRSLSGVVLGKGITKVIVRAHDSVHKYGGKEWFFSCQSRGASSSSSAFNVSVTYPPYIDSSEMSIVGPPPKTLGGRFFLLNW